MQLPDLVGMYLNRYLVEPIGEFLNISESIIILILIGVGIVIFGYWIKLWVEGFSKASEDMEKEIKRLKEEQLKKNKLTINQKATLWILDGYGVRLCNKIGFTIILIGIIFLLINKII
jgi:hypothetical protein